MSSSTRALFNRALSLLPSPGSNPHVHLALSGGVDSSVSGLLLRERGYVVHPVLLRCWDDGQTDTGSSCFSTEFRAAESAVKALKLKQPLRNVDLVSVYWTRVFEGELLSGLRAGRNPNADLACNRHIKFGALPSVLRDLTGGPVRLATGHYSRIDTSPHGQTRLLAGVDPIKDQSYFLASVNSAALDNILMPVGALRKTEVREIACWAGLPAAEKRSSRGLCFVGKRPFAEFVSEFIEGPNARFVCATNPTMELGPAEWPAWAYTVGQRARVGGMSERMFVVGVRDSDVYLARWEDWRLWTKGVVCDRVDWICEEPDGIEDGLEVHYKCCSTAMRRPGRLWKEKGFVNVQFCKEERRVSDGQAVVLYQGDVCLGAAWPVDQKKWLLPDQGLPLSEMTTKPFVRGSMSTSKSSRSLRFYPVSQ